MVMSNFQTIDSIINQAISQSHDRNELWIHIITALYCRKLCEIGVYKGEFSAKLLQSIPIIEQYILIDPWKNLLNWNKPANLSDEHFN